jgi:hypothetical protein
MNSTQLNDLKSRAKKFIGSKIPISKMENGKIVEIECTFIEIAGETGVGEEGDMTYQINGLLKGPEGNDPRPLKEIVRYFESKKG